MKKARLYTSLDFTELKPEQIQRMVRDLYESDEDQKREAVFGQSEDRRQAERRQENKLVMLDTRSKQSRRQSPGRRQQDSNPENRHKVGVDYYA